MASLNLIVDLVDNASNYDTTPAPRGKILSRIKSVFSSNKPISRNIFAGGTDYSEAKVANILRDFLQPNTKLSLVKAAKALLELIPANSSEYGQVYSFGEICVELAGQIPYHHPSQIKFAQLLSYISKSPKFISKYPLPPREELWQPYQLLFEAFTDSYDGPDIENPSEWVNLNACLAHIAATCIRGVSAWKGPSMMRQAFESKLPDEAWERDCTIMAAAQWILWHGQTLFKLIQFDYYEEKTTERGLWWLGKAYTGPPIQPRSLERWRFWQKGFEAVENDTDAGEECKMVAKRTAQLMAALEQTMFFPEIVTESEKDLENA